MDNVADFSKLVNRIVRLLIKSVSLVDYQFQS